ncbi:MAG: DUF748 domain-containing protein [Candidatus Electrothrix aestuarii]|uniref:DUF748 domain-containing protein n=1 Tax=Candidatus Electrothrix aestuarii TaxID=3062594 RepID=A0AAU8LS12_9BACT|nr:DUF748 domain-containing protein [Candidatus Electrothrix aestuarii]
MSCRINTVDALVMKSRSGQETHNMTGEPQNPDADSSPDFGEIPINPNAGEKRQKEDQPPSPPPKPKAKPKRPRKQRPKKNKRALPKKKLLLCGFFLLVLPIVLLLSYLAAAHYLLPYYIREHLAQQYSQQLHRPVAVTQVEFAPFSLELQLADIHIGPEFERQEQNDPALCHIATIDTRLGLQNLLRGNIILEDMQIKGMQTELVRRADGSFTNLAWAKQGKAADNQALLPSWLHIDGLSLSESMLVIRDVSTGHKYHLDEISFSLPSAAHQQEETVPTLHALVNGDPIQIRGQRQILADGSAATRLVLQLDNVDPQQILAWLPGTKNNLRITSEQTKASLELIWPDNPQDEEGLILSGRISFAGMDLKTLAANNGASGEFRCKAPRAELILQANPFRKQYKVEELTLEAPQFVISGSSKSKTDDTDALSLFPLSEWTVHLLNPTVLPVDLSIDRLTIYKGSIQRNQDPPWEDFLLELTNYQNRVPQSDNAGEQEQQPPALSFSAQQRKSTVNFQGTTSPDLQLSGELSFTNLDSSLLQPYLGAKQGVQLSGGKTGLVMQVDPQHNIVKELSLEQPLLVLANLPGNSSPQLPLSLWPGQLLDPSALPFSLKLQHLSISKGTVRKGKKALWEDLQLELSTYENQKATKSPLSFSTHQGVETIRFQGHAASDLSLNGKISFHNLEADLLQPYLSADQSMQFSGGKADLNGLLQTKQGKDGKREIRIEQGTLKIPVIRLSQGKQKQAKDLLTASILEAQGCTLHLSSPALSCSDLALQEADFSPQAAGFFLFPDKGKSPLNLSLKNIKIVDSKAWLPLDELDGNENQNNGLTIPLTKLNLEFTNLQQPGQKKDNLHLQAAIGPAGRIKADGTYHQGQANLQLTAEDMNITLLNPAFERLFKKDLAPALQQGHLSFQGLFRVPEFAFQGDVTLRDLRTANRQGTGLSWKNGQAKQVLVGMKPFFMHMDELVLDEPSLKLPSAQSKVPDALTALLRTEKEKPVLPPFTLKQCSIKNGSMPGAGTRLDFREVNGSLAHAAAGTPASFTFSGKANTRKFASQGRLEQDRATLDEFTIAELPMETAAQQFVEHLGLEKKGAIRWVPSAEGKDQGQLDCKDFRPRQDSEYALLLALLTDNEEEFSLPLSLPATALPAEISKAALETLHRLHLQAVVSPQAVLEKELPDLTLPQRIDFVVGDSLPDFMTSLENFSPLLERRPYIGLQIQGRYDDTADREYLLRLLQEEEDYRVNLENDRRKEEMARLLAEEELRQVELVNTDMPIGEDLIPVIEARVDLQPLPHTPIELPKEILPELARQRAKVIREYLLDTIKLPAERVILTKPSPGGPRVDIQIVPLWHQAAESKASSTQEQKD